MARGTRKLHRNVMNVRSANVIKSFEKMLEKGPTTLVYINAKWCGACHGFTKNVWDPLTKLKNKSMNLAAVDSEMIGKTSLASVPKKFYPTLLLVGKDKKAATFKDEMGLSTNAMPRASTLEEDKKVLTQLVQTPVSSMSVKNNTRRNNKTKSNRSVAANGSTMNRGRSASVAANSSMMNRGRSASVTANSSMMNRGRSASVTPNGSTMNRGRSPSVAANSSMMNRGRSASVSANGSTMNRGRSATVTANGSTINRARSASVTANSSMMNRARSASVTANGSTMNRGRSATVTANGSMMNRGRSASMSSNGSMMNPNVNQSSLSPISVQRNTLGKSPFEVRSPSVSDETMKSTFSSPTKILSAAPPDVGSDIVASQSKSTTSTAGVIGSTVTKGGMLNAIRNKTASIRAMLQSLKKHTFKRR